MARIKGATMTHKRRKKMLKLAKRSEEHTSELQSH